jgi:hypothetical protein
VSILVTDGCGFIVICETDIAAENQFVELMTVNGETTREMAIGFEILS